jgi:hypothetical protein
MWEADLIYAPHRMPLPFRCMQSPETAIIMPEALGLPFGSWTLDRLVAYLTEVKGVTMKRSRLSEIFRHEGLRWRHQEGWFGMRVDPDFAEKRGQSSNSRPHRLRQVSLSA